MKRIRTFSILTAALLFMLCACGKTEVEQNTGSQTRSTSEGTENMENTGDTSTAGTADNSGAEAAKALENMAENFVLIPGETFQMGSPETGGDLFSIRVEELYSADYDECLDRAADEKAENARPVLIEKVLDMTGYDTVFLSFRIGGTVRRWLCFLFWRKMISVAKRWCCFAPMERVGWHPV